MMLKLVLAVLIGLQTSPYSPGDELDDYLEKYPNPLDDALSIEQALILFEHVYGKTISLPTEIPIAYTKTGAYFNDPPYVLEMEYLDERTNNSLRFDVYLKDDGMGFLDSGEKVALGDGLYGMFDLRGERKFLTYEKDELVYMIGIFTNSPLDYKQELVNVYRSQQ